MTIPRDGRVRRPAGTLASLTIIAAALVTFAVLVLPFLHFAARAPAVQVMLETANAVMAAVVGYLVYGRFRQHRRMQELLLGLALGTVALANLVLTALPDALTFDREEEFSHWAPLTVRLVGTVLFAAAALTPRSVRAGPRTASLVTLGLLGVLGGLGVAGALWGELLPRAVDPMLLGDSSRALLVAHPLVVTVHAVSLVLYGVAAFAFTERAERTGDELLRWVGAGCVLASVARVHYLLFPSLYSEYVYSGDFLRLGFYMFMLVGAAREITSFWEAKAQTAVLEDRRRIARDLHDGLIQELSYIHAQSRRLTERPGDAVTVQRIGGAAGRAVDEARRALEALTRVDDADFTTVLQQSLDEMASRYDVKIVTDLEPHVEVDGPMADALLRISGEAVRNAVRHGEAQRIDVTLTAVPLSLIVIDDGRGFPAHRPDGGRTGGFGLTSMRERAATIGAGLSIESAPGMGTTVRVSWI
jgi:signal transduction histidine kinase